MPGESPACCSTEPATEAPLLILRQLHKWQSGDLDGNTQSKRFVLETTTLECHIGGWVVMGKVPLPSLRQQGLN